MIFISTRSSLRNIAYPADFNLYMLYLFQDSPRITYTVLFISHCINNVHHIYMWYIQGDKEHWTYMKGTLSIYERTYCLPWWICDLSNCRIQCFTCGKNTTWIFPKVVYFHIGGIINLPRKTRNKQHIAWEKARMESLQWHILSFLKWRLVCKLQSATIKEQSIWFEQDFRQQFGVSSN